MNAIQIAQFHSCIAIQNVPPRQPPPKMAHRAKEVGKKIFKTSKGIYTATTPDDLLGKGTYGVVYRVHNEKDPNDVKAVKTFTPETMDENEGIPPTTLREINSLRVLKHPNVLKAEEIVLPQGQQALTEMFVVMELCKGTLKDKACEMILRLLKSDPKYYSFPQGKCPSSLKLPAAYVREAKLVSYQLLNALAYVHSRGIMHRDLKPVNIMWGFDDLLKFGDFGLARFMRGNQNSRDSVLPQTGEVQTMWYRAPEVLLGDETYGAQVDDWSIGCVIAELFRFRKSTSSNRVEPEPLFNGRSDPETLLMIFETLGRPRIEEPGKSYLATLPYWTNEYPKWDRGTLRKRIPLIDELGLDLVDHLLRISPCERHVAKHLLDHAWFDDVRDSAKKLVPWFAGLERGFELMAAVDRLPPAQPLCDIEKRKEVEEKGRYKANAKCRNPSYGMVGQTEANCQRSNHQVPNTSYLTTNSRTLSSSQPDMIYGIPSDQGIKNVVAQSTQTFDVKQRSHSEQRSASNNVVSSNSILHPLNKNIRQHQNTDRGRTQQNVAADTSSTIMPLVQELELKSQTVTGSNSAEYHPNSSKTRPSKPLPSIITARSSSPSVQSELTLIHEADKSSELPISSSRSLVASRTTDSNVQPNHNIDEIPVEPKKTRAAPRAKRVAPTTRRRAESRQSSAASKAVASGRTDACVWASISRSRSPDRGTGVSVRATKRGRSDNKLPPKQSQLPFVRIPVNNDSQVQPIQRSQSTQPSQVSSHRSETLESSTAEDKERSTGIIQRANAVKSVRQMSRSRSAANVDSSQQQGTRLSSRAAAATRAR